MSTVLPNMGLTQPTLGGDSGTWDDELNADLGLVDAHDHSSGKGLQVPTAGLNINADLTFAGLYAPINLHHITFASIVAIISGSNQSLFVSDGTLGLTLGELYWRNHSGVNVKLTAGAALNVAAFTGGFGGDYAAAGAAAAFDNSNKLYTFKDGAGNYARNVSGGVRLIEFGTAEAVYVGLKAPSALAVSYDVTLPLAAPGSTSLVQMDSAGVLSASNTVANAVTLSAAVTLGSTIGKAGALLTFPAALPGALSYLTMTTGGTLGTVATGATIQFPIGLAVVGAGVTMSTNPTTLSFGTSVVGNSLPITLPVGSVVTSWTLWLRKTSASGTIQAQLASVNGSSGSTVSYGVNQQNSANNPGFIQLTNGGLSVTIASGLAFEITVLGGGVTGDNAYAYSVTYT